MHIQWYLGTMGFSYQDWRGVFYPREMAARNYLKHYSKIFNAVEIDSTFYGTPPADRVIRWGQITPSNFKFCVKAPRGITHELRLRGVGSKDLLDEFLKTIQLLGSKLGVILFQFPPDFSLVERIHLERFLPFLPKDFLFAIEFRHPTWYTPDTVELLKGSGVCWASTDYRNLPKEMQIVTDFVYIRWIGWHGRYPKHNQEYVDQRPGLQTWSQRINAIAEQVNAIYGFFNNDYAGYAPATCNTFKDIVGLEKMIHQQPQQRRLL